VSTVVGEAAAESSLGSNRIKEAFPLHSTRWDQLSFMSCQRHNDLLELSLIWDYRESVDGVLGSVQSNFRVAILQVLARRKRTNLQALRRPIRWPAPRRAATRPDLPLICIAQSPCAF